MVSQSVSIPTGAPTMDGSTSLLSSDTPGRPRMKNLVYLGKLGSTRTCKSTQRGPRQNRVSTRAAGAARVPQHASFIRVVVSPRPAGAPPLSPMILRKKTGKEDDGTHDHCQRNCLGEVHALDWHMRPAVPECLGQKVSITFWLAYGKYLPSQGHLQSASVQVQTHEMDPFPQTRMDTVPLYVCFFFLLIDSRAPPPPFIAHGLERMRKKFSILFLCLRVLPSPESVICL